MSKGMYILLALTYSVLCFAGSDYTLDYSRLQTKNLDEMRALIQGKLNEAQSALDDEDDVDAAVKSLQEGLRVALSRPDGDNMVTTLVADIRPRLKDLDAFEKSIDKIAVDAMAGLKNKKEKPTLRATHLIVLENILGEFKPDVKNSADIKKTFTRIRDAKIEIPEEVHNDLRLRGMFKSPVSPSDIAAKIIASKPSKK